MKKMITLFLVLPMGFAFSQQEFDIDGDLKLQGNLIFGDETTMSTVPQGTPVGTIVMFAGVDPPEGWFLCDGEEVSRTEYSQLFDVVENNYGGGDGINTFNLPDFTGRVGVGLKSGQDVYDSMGDIGGQTAPTHAEHTHSHNHSTTADDGVHYHGIGSGYAGSAYNYASQTQNYISTAYTENAGSHNHSIPEITSTSSYVGDQNYGNMQPYITINYIIKY